ncbi:hypothetical protein TcWFU_003391 [Taenia crassiceps]|uniref:Uncharacterized protein n=1 Tax=Taenia crassiceps TaxID=6207 RepID=A0ABR4QKG5_9CEST
MGWRLMWCACIKAPFRLQNCYFSLKMFATLLLLSCLAMDSWSFQVDQSIPQTMALTDADLDVMEGPQLLKWPKRRLDKPAFYIPDDDVPTYLSGLRYLRSAQKRFKPKMPIFLGLIGKRK